MKALSDSERKVALANAHAAWIATSQNPRVDALHNLKQALIKVDYIASWDTIIDVHMEGTSICVDIDADEFCESILLDAYGNVSKAVAS